MIVLRAESLMRYQQKGKGHKLREIAFAKTKIAFAQEKRK